MAQRQKKPRAARGREGALRNAQQPEPEPEPVLKPEGRNRATEARIAAGNRATEARIAAGNRATEARIAAGNRATEKK